MQPVLADVLNAICLERDDDIFSDATLDAVEHLVRAYGEEGLADRLFDEIPRTAPYELVVDLFNLLIWQTKDNGGALVRTCERWLKEGNDNRRLLVALHLDVYPFLYEQEMETVLLRLAEERPKVAVQCRQLISGRRAIPKNQSLSC